MAVTLSHRMILSSVCRYLYRVLPRSLSVSWNGMRIDTQDLSQWIEVSLGRQSRIRQRRVSNDHREIEIQIRIFQKPGSNMLGHLRLERKIVAALEHRDIDVLDYATAGEPNVGKLRVLESQSNDFTRSFNEQGYTDNRSQELNQLLRTNVKAIQLTFKALVQAV